MNPDAATINTFLLSGGTTAAVYLLLSVLKPYIEGPLPPTARLHDPVLKSLALVLGVVIEVVAHGLIAPLSSQRVFLDIGIGALAGLAAIGTHQLPKGTPGADPGPGDLLTGLAALLPASQPTVQRLEVTHILPQKPSDPSAGSPVPATPPSAPAAPAVAMPNSISSTVPVSATFTGGAPLPPSTAAAPATVGPPPSSTSTA